MSLSPRLLAFTGAALLALGACTNLPTDLPKTPSTALRQVPRGGIAGALDREAARHGGKSGFAVIGGNRQSFTDRIALIDSAQKTIDVQTYIWSPDTIGKILVDHIIRAAQRGVRVRCLVDDLNLTTKDNALAALAAHPNIEVRLFNPRRLRGLKTIEFIANFGRLNHRMHNKTTVVDNGCAIIGGRNLADEYFGLHDRHNLRDLDIVAVGPIVRKISGVFDEFWNSDASVPIESLLREKKNLADFQREVAALRRGIRPGRYPYPLTADVKSIGARLAEARRQFVWAQGEVLHDAYDSLWTGRGETVRAKLFGAIGQAEKEVHLEAAYFVMRRPGIEFMRSLRARGVAVRAVTNSLASNDVAAAQAGYSTSRDDLLAAGVQVHELRTDAAAALDQVAPQGRRGTVGIHTKALVIDRRRTFVGSYNLDPRSAEINSEVGLLVDSPEFARRVAIFLDQGARTENSYRVTLTPDGRKQWETIVDGQRRTWTVDPETTGWQRVKNTLIGLLPIKGQL